MYKEWTGETKIFVHYVEKALRDIFVILNENCAVNLCKKEKRFKTAFLEDLRNRCDSDNKCYT